MSIQTQQHDVISPTVVEHPHVWRWYHGLAYYLLMQVLTFGLSGLTSALRQNKPRNTRNAFFGNPDYFLALKQSKITPPAWVFGPAWTVNNLSVIWGSLRVLNKPAATAGRRAYLGLQLATWLDYICFNAAYFSLRSPINAFALTLLFLLLTVASGVVALFRLKDTVVALSLLTTFIWLLIAITAATTQMLWNRDEFYGLGPFTTPRRTWIKK